MLSYDVTLGELFCDVRLKMSDTTCVQQRIVTPFGFQPMLQASPVGPCFMLEPRAITSCEHLFFSAVALAASCGLILPLFLEAEASTASGDLFWPLFHIEIASDVSAASSSPCRVLNIESQKI